MMDQGGREPRRRGVGLSVVLSLMCGACGPDSPSDSSSGWTEAADDRVTLTVTVVDLSTGAPIAGAWVSLAGRDAMTDGDGVATLDAVESGAVTVMASAVGYVPSTAATIDLGAAGGSVSVDLVPLDLVSARVDGMVTGPGPWAAGVEGAVVSVDGMAVATTDADGSFAFDIAPSASAAVRVDPPAGAALVDWAVEGVALDEGAGVHFGVSLAARPPDDAAYVGSAACAACHPDAVAGHAETPHGASGRDPSTLTGALDGLDDRFSAGEVVDLSEAVAGASIALDSLGGEWTADIADNAGRSTGPLPVIEVYGGWRAGAALAVEVDGLRYLLPVGWALDGQGLSSGQAAADWVSTYTDGWFDADGQLDLDSAGRPGQAASWDLQCAGCHATGHRLVESPAGVYQLDARESGDVMERQVGCESCHGPGSEHVAADSATASSTILNPALLAPSRRVEVCARCHERSAVESHPFSDAPAWPTATDGAALGPLDLVSDNASPAPASWTTAEPSRLFRDQVGDLRASPHQDTAAGYVGACEDCHTVHEPGDGASLRTEPGALALCTTCHAAAFPDEASVLDHSAHPYVEEERFGSASCQGCHVPRIASNLAVDAISGAGEGHAHGLRFVAPQAAVDEFDAAGVDELPLGSVPTPACLDCHEQRAAEAEEAGEVFVSLRGDPTERDTYEDLQWAYDILFGGAE